MMGQLAGNVITAVERAAAMLRDLSLSDDELEELAQLEL